MSSLEKAIEMAGDNLPTGWSLKIEVENGWGGVTGIDPDGKEFNMDDGQCDLSEQVLAVVSLARDHIAAANMDNKAIQ